MLVWNRHSNGLLSTVPPKFMMGLESDYVTFFSNKVFVGVINSVIRRVNLVGPEIQDGCAFT